MSKKMQPKQSALLLAALIAVVTAVIAAVMVWPVLSQRTPQPDLSESVTGKPAASEPAETAPAGESQAAAPTLDQTDYNLGYGLKITDSGQYSGMYVEDGTNEIVSDVMMLVIRNDGEKDVQLAEITALCGGEEYRFTLTNLAAGERAVLLEQERKAAAALSSAVLDNCVLFSEPMGLCEDVLQIGGLDGMLNVKNISGADIQGDIYICYKYAARDLLYGGITFRVQIEGGLKAGELRQIPAGHYTPDGCALVQVTVHE